jgi:hypothetical protein
MFSEQQDNIMVGVIIAENSDTVVIILDKTYFPKKNIERAIGQIEKEALDFSHIPFVSAEEQAEISASLAAMSDEDRAIGMTTEREG